MKFLEPAEYQKKTETTFHLISEKLLVVLLRPRIEHIGSSAIEGALSKDDLDIFVGVDRERFQSSLEKILNLGFLIKEDTHRDQSLCMLISENYDCDVSIQLVENGSKYEFF